MSRIRGCRERFDADFLETLVAHSSGRYFSAAPRLGDRDQARDRSPALLRGRRLAPMCYRSSSLRVSWRRRSASRGGRGNRTDLYRRVRVVLRVMLFRSTSARHRIRHGIRHTAERAGRGLCPCVANGRLRYMLIGYSGRSGRLGVPQLPRSLGRRTITCAPHRMSIVAHRGRGIRAPTRVPGKPGQGGQDAVM